MWPILSIISIIRKYKWKWLHRTTIIYCIATWITYLFNSEPKEIGRIIREMLLKSLYPFACSAIAIWITNENVLKIGANYVVITGYCILHCSDDFERHVPLLVVYAYNELLWSVVCRYYRNVFNILFAILNGFLLVIPIIVINEIISRTDLHTM